MSDLVGIAEAIRLVVLDADGVLTDGGIYVLDREDGRAVELRRFHVRDGIGVALLRRAGLEVAIVSGKVSSAVRERARTLGIEEVHQVAPAKKLAVVADLLERRGLAWKEVAYLGDDLPDLPVMKRVGLPCAVADAVPEVVDAARWRGSVPGGAGAVRELAESLLRASGRWTELVEGYLSECEAAWERSRR